MTFCRYFIFSLLIPFYITFLIAQEPSGSLVATAKQKYREAQQENDLLNQDPSNTQRQKAIRSLREALDLYGQIIEQYPETEESLAEDMVVLNSLLFWTRKFAPIDFKEDESATKPPDPPKPSKTSKPPESSTNEVQESSSLPAEIQNIEVKRIEPPPEIDPKIKAQDPARQAKYPMETAHHFRKKIAKLLQNRRFFEAIEHSKNARLNALNPEYQQELDGLTEDLQLCLQLYQQWIEALKDTSSLTLNFKLITGLKLEGSAKKFDQKNLHIEGTQGKFGVNLFMLSTETLIEMAKLKKLPQLEGYGNLLALLEGNTIKTSEWFKTHPEFKNAGGYLKKIELWKSQEKQVESLEKERAKRFKNEEKAYDLLSQVLEEMTRKDYNKALFEISKMPPLLTEEIAQEMEPFLKKELKTNWYSLISDLRQNCETCNKQRTISCKPCDGKGRTKNPPHFSAKPDSSGQFICPKCKGKGSVQCGACIWRFQDPKAEETERIFFEKIIPQEITNQKLGITSFKDIDKTKKSKITGEVRWGETLCQDAKVYITLGVANSSSIQFGSEPHVQSGGYFSFDVYPSIYDLIYWRNESVSRKRIVVDEPLVHFVLQLQSEPIYFVNPENQGNTIARPAFLKWLQNNEEHFVVKIFEEEIQKGFSRYKPILISHQIGNTLLLPKKETIPGKIYWVVVYGYGGTQLMTQGRISFKVK